MYIAAFLVRLFLLALEWWWQSVHFRDRINNKDASIIIQSFVRMPAARDGIEGTSVQGGFVPVAPSTSCSKKASTAATLRQRRPASALSSSSGDNKDEDDGVDRNKNQKKLSQLGYSPAEIQRSRDKDDSRRDDDDIRVNVNLLPDVDAVTLTAVGFGLIAANFFIFANMGDGGIAGMGKYYSAWRSATGD